METRKNNSAKTIETDCIAVINYKHKIIGFNESASRITGFREQDFEATDFNLLFDAAYTDHTYIKKAFDEGKAFSNLTLRLKTADGKPLSVLASITPVKESSKSTTVIVAFKDLHEIAQLTQTIKETIDEKNRFETIFHGVSDGIFTIDNNWIIRSFNRAAEEITGYSRNEAKGAKCWSIFNSTICRNGCHMEETLNKNCLMSNRELSIKHKNGQKIPIRVKSAPLINSKKECIGGIETFSDVSEIVNLHEHLKERFHFENIVGTSKPMYQMYELLYNVAHSDSTVLITGESGTGKELVARAIHLNSERHLKPFITVNCSAFAETLLESELFGYEEGAFTGATKTKPGRFELANEGTLFLDEIGDISPAIQIKLLRVIESLQFERVGGTKPINVNLRIVVATNKDLQNEIRDNRFREDLYYRINVVNIHMPPLRNRLDDVPLLIDHFINKFREKFKSHIETVSSDALNILMSYPWPGNIRELENVIEHAFVLCRDKSILPDHLPKWLVKQYKDHNNGDSIPLNTDYIKDAEKDHVLSVLEKFSGNKGKAAQALGIDKSTLWRKMKKFNIDI